MATHSSIIALEIPWIEEPGGLQSMSAESQTWLCTRDALSGLDTDTFLLNLHMAGREFLSHPFSLGTNATMRAPSSWSNHLPKTPNTFTLGVRASVWIGWGEGHKHSVHTKYYPLTWSFLPVTHYTESESSTIMFPYASKMGFSSLYPLHCSLLLSSIITFMASSHLYVQSQLPLKSQTSLCRCMHACSVLSNFFRPHEL